MKMQRMMAAAMVGGMMVLGSVGGASTPIDIGSAMVEMKNCAGCCAGHGGVTSEGGVTKCKDGSALSEKCAAKGCTYSPPSKKKKAPKEPSQPTPSKE